MRNRRAVVQKRAEAQRVSEEYMMQMPRRWREGDVFTPHDLTGNEMRKWRKRVGRTEDVFDLVGINPLDHYRVSIYPSLLSNLRRRPELVGACNRLTRTAELHPDFRLYERHGPHYALEPDGPAPPEPAQDGQDHPPGHGHGHPPQCPPAPRAPPAGVAGSEVSCVRGG